MNLALIGTLFFCKSLKSLSQVTTKIGSGSTPKGGKSVYLSYGIPFIRSLNVRMRYFTTKDIVFVDQATHENMRGTQIQPNDVLLNITGASIGRVTCIPESFLEGNINQHTSIIRPKSDILNYKYLMWWLSQPMIQDYINDEQKGATRQGFTKAQISSFKIPIPPLSEQKRIVEYLDRLQSKIEIMKKERQKALEETDALLPSILDKAFKGEL